MPFLSSSSSFLPPLGRSSFLFSRAVPSSSSPPSTSLLFCCRCWPCYVASRRLVLVSLHVGERKRRHSNLCGEIRGKKNHAALFFSLNSSVSVGWLRVFLSIHACAHLHSRKTRTTHHTGSFSFALRRSSSSSSFFARSRALITDCDEMISSKTYICTCICAQENDETK